MKLSRLFVTADRRAVLAWRVVAYALAFAACLMLRALLAGKTAAMVEGLDIGAWRLVIVEVVASFVAVGATLLMTMVFRRRVDRRPWAGIAMPAPRRCARGLTGGFLLGIGMILAIFSVELAAGWLHVRGLKEGFTPSAIVAVLIARLIHFWATALCEETAYRGYLLQNIAERYPLWIAALITGAVFGASHFPATGLAWRFLVAAVIASFYLTHARLVTGAIWFGIAWHWSWDWTQDALGMGPGYSPLDTRRLGPALWVGHRALEDGLLAIGALASGWAILSLLARATERHVNWNTRLSADGRPLAETAETGSDYSVGAA